MRNLCCLILVLVVMGMFAVPNAMAGKAPKPPKSICFSMDEDSDELFEGWYLVLGFKKGAKVQDSSEKIYFYDVHGLLANGMGSSRPISGTGHYAHGSDQYLIHISGNYGYSTFGIQIHLEGAAPSAYGSISGGGVAPDPNLFYDLTEVECKSINMNGPTI